MNTDIIDFDEWYERNVATGKRPEAIGQRSTVMEAPPVEPPASADFDEWYDRNIDRGQIRRSAPTQTQPVPALEALSVEPPITPDFDEWYERNVDTGQTLRRRRTAPTETESMSMPGMPPPSAEIPVIKKPAFAPKMESSTPEDYSVNKKGLGDFSINLLGMVKHKERNEQNLAPDLVNALARGIDVAGESFGGLMEMLHIPGGKYVKGVYKERAERPEIQRPEYLQDGTVIDHPERLADARWWVNSIGENIPNMAMMLAPGVAGYKIGTGLKLSTETAIKLGTAGGAVGAFTIEAGSAYNDAKEEMLDMGYDEKQANKIATIEGSIVGTVNAILEVAPFNVLLKNPGAKKLFTRIVRQGLLEGGTEGVQENVTMLAAKLGHKPDTDWKNWLGRTVESGIIGFTLGAPTGIVNISDTQTKKPSSPEQPTEPPPVRDASTPMARKFSEEIAKEQSSRRPLAGLTEKETAIKEQAPLSGPMTGRGESVTDIGSQSQVSAAQAEQKRNADALDQTLLAEAELAAQKADTEYVNTVLASDQAIGQTRRQEERPAPAEIQPAPPALEAIGDRQEVRQRRDAPSAFHARFAMTEKTRPEARTDFIPQKPPADIAKILASDGAVPIVTRMFEQTLVPGSGGAGTKLAYGLAFDGFFNPSIDKIIRKVHDDFVSRSQTPEGMADGRQIQVASAVREAGEMIRFIRDGEQNSASHNFETLVRNSEDEILTRFRNAIQRAEEQYEKETIDHPGAVRPAETFRRDTDQGTRAQKTPQETGQKQEAIDTRPEAPAPKPEVRGVKGSPPYGETLRPPAARLRSDNEIPAPSLPLPQKPETRRQKPSAVEVLTGTRRKKSAQPVGKEPWKWNGKAYRGETNRLGKRTESAADVIRYERDELGNTFETDYLTPDAIKQLESRPASDLIWVTKKKEDAARYLLSDVAAKVTKKEIDAVDEYSLPKDSVVLASDGDGGYLVLKGGWKPESPAQRTPTEQEGQTLRRRRAAPAEMQPVEEAGQRPVPDTGANEPWIFTPDIARSQDAVAEQDESYSSAAILSDTTQAAAEIQKQLPFKEIISEVPAQEFEKTTGHSLSDAVPQQAQRVRMATTGHIAAQGHVVSSADDAAALLAQIRKSAQENAYTITVDAQGTVLEIHRFSKGLTATAHINTVQIAGQVMNIDGAAKTYFVHNHPSGNTLVSTQDRDTLRHLKLLLNLKHIDADGLVICNQEYVSFDTHGGVTVKPIRPTIRRTTLPVKERSLIRGAVTPVEVNNSTKARDLIQTRYNDQDGILLIGPNLRVLDFIEFPAGKPVRDAAADIMARAEAVNATSYVVYSKKSVDIQDAPANNRGWFLASLGKLLKNDLVLLDIIENDKSMADTNRLKHYKFTPEPGHDEHYTPLAEDGILYSIQQGEKSVPAFPELSLTDIRNGFPGQDVGLFADGSSRIWVRTQGGVGFTVQMLERMDESTGRIAMETGRMNTENDIIDGMYHNFTISLDKWFATKKTLSHETVHALEHAGILTPGDIRVLKTYITQMDANGKWGKTREGHTVGGREDRAEWIAAEMADFVEANNPKNFTGTLRRILKKIQDWMDWIVNLIHRTPQGIARDIRTGKIYEQHAKRISKLPYLTTQAERLHPASDPDMIWPSKTAPLWRSVMMDYLQSPKGLPAKEDPASLKKLLTSWADKGHYKRQELDDSGILEWLSAMPVKGSPGYIPVTRRRILGHLKKKHAWVSDVVYGAPGLLTEARNIPAEERGPILPFDDIATEETPFHSQAFTAVQRTVTDRIHGYTIISSVDDAGFTLNYDLHAPNGKLVGEFGSYDDAVTGAIDQHIFDTDQSAPVKYSELYTMPGYEEGTQREIVLWTDAAEKLKYPDEAHYVEGYGGFRQIAWARTGIHSLPDGTRYLMANEIQSKRHQRARDTRNRLITRLIQNGMSPEAARESVPVTYGYMGYPDIPPGHKVERSGDRWVLKDMTGRELITAPGNLTQEQATHKFIQLHSKQGEADAPYKGTKIWSLLTLKRLVSHAVRNRLDGVAWPDGNIIADWTGIRTDIDVIYYKQFGDEDLFELYTADANGNPVSLTGPAQPGMSLRDCRAVLTAEEIEKRFGQHVRKQIEDRSGHPAHPTSQYKGYTYIDPGKVTIGGEELTAFYNEMLPRIANKFFGTSSWGNARVETRQTSDGKNIHYLKITPEMHDRVLTQGMPLFSRREFFVPKFTDKAQAEAFGKIVRPSQIPTMRTALEDKQTEALELAKAGRKPQSETASRQAMFIRTALRAAEDKYPAQAVIKVQEEDIHAMISKLGQELTSQLETLDRVDQARFTQVAQGSITALPKRYTAALEIATRFRALEKELHRLGVLAPDDSLRQLTRKDIAAQLDKIKHPLIGINAKIEKLKKDLEPIIHYLRTIKKLSEDIAEDLVVETLARSGVDFKTRASKSVAVNEDKIRAAMKARGYEPGEVDSLIDRIKNSLFAVENFSKTATLKDIREKVTQAISRTIRAGTEKLPTYGPHRMEAAKKTINDIRQLKNERAAILRRIHRHYKNSGKHYLQRISEWVKTEQKSLPIKKAPVIESRQAIEPKVSGVAKENKLITKKNIANKWNEVRLATENPINNFRAWLQDKNVPFEVIQAKLKNIHEDIDVFLKETQRPKIVADNIIRFYNDSVKPILSFMAKKDIAIDEVEEYSHALHVPEALKANEEANSKRYLDDLVGMVPEEVAKPIKIGMASLLKSKRQAAKESVSQYPVGISPKEHNQFLNKAFELFKDEKGVKELKAQWDAFKSNSAGMTLEQAQEIIKAYNGDEDIETARKMMAAINNERLELLFDAGVIGQEEYEAYKNKYEYYAPLHREGYNDGLFGVSRGLKQTGRPVKTRMGSNRKVVNILGHTVANFERAINLAEKARSQRALVEMVKANPDPEMWTLKEEKKAPRYDKYGNIQMYEDIFNVADNEFRIKADGKQYILEVDRDNPNLMLMMKTLKAENNTTGPLVNSLSFILRFLARVYTTWSPEFMFSNFPRDLQTAMINIGDTGIKSKQMFRGALTAAKAIWNVETGRNKNTELELLYDRFKKAGGKINWADVHGSVENLAKKLKADLETLSGKRPTRKAIAGWFKMVENLNTSVENGVRLHVFKLAIEQGFSDAKAAQMASNITVDFTKKGYAGPAINSLYLFANAGIQGSYRIWQAASKSKAVRKSIGKIVFFGFLAGLYNSLAGGEDKDGEDYYNKIDDYLRKRSAIFMLPRTGGHFIKIPLPWGYNFFYNIGAEASRMFTKKKYNLWDSVFMLGGTFVEAFNPIQSGTLLQTLSPTITDPFAMVAENKNWFGGPLMPEGDAFDKTPPPDSQKYWPSARGSSVFAAQWLNSMSGGNKVKSGAIDISPETIDLMIDTAGGSALNFFTDLGALPIAAIRREKIQIHQYPFLRRVYGTKPEWADSRIYYKNIENVLQAKEQLEAYKGTDYYHELYNELEPQRRMFESARQSERQLRNLRKLKRYAEAANNKEAVKTIEKQMNQVYLKFNKQINELPKKAK